MSIRRSRLVLSALVLVLAVTMSAPASASDVAPGASGGHHGPPSQLFPTTIPLPDGFQPEGIAIGSQPYAYFSSLDHGSIYRANLVTGRGDLLSEGPGTASVGLELDSRGRLFVAGGDAGDARVVDTRTGELLASYQFASDETFVNDVILTPDAAWFTDSFDPVLYKLPLDRHGALPDPNEVVTVPLTGDIVFEEDFNANGITRTPNRDGFLVVQSNTGLLFRVEPDGVTTQVDLGGETLLNADGMLLRGRTLYVVQNVDNQVAVVEIDRTGTTGTVVDRLTDPRFDTPTTVAAFSNRIYLPNIQSFTEPSPDTPYSAVALQHR